MDNVKNEWRNNCYTAEGAYIAPSPMNNTKNYIKKLLKLINKDTGQIHDFELKKVNQNYNINNNEIFSIIPNPLKDYANISFELENNSNVTIAVYDLNGRYISSIINNELLSSGIHEITWNPDNVPSGLYICKLIVNNEIYNRRILLEE